VRSSSTIRGTATMTAETGRPWSPATVEGIVKRETYKLGKPARIIDPRVWNASQAALARRRRRPAA
jgi:hypothetical protein